MDYRRDNGTEARTSKITGIAVTVAVHAALVAAAAFSDLGALTTLYPPPQEQSMLIEFEELKPEAIREKAGREPQAVEIDRSKPMNLVQQSQGQFTGKSQNVAKEATLGPDGDVEVPEPVREKEIDRRALFHSAANKSEQDTLAAQTSYQCTSMSVVFPYLSLFQIFQHLYGYPLNCYIVKKHIFHFVVFGMESYLFAFVVQIVAFERCLVPDKRNDDLPYLCSFLLANNNQITVVNPCVYHANRGIDFCNAR